MTQLDAFKPTPDQALAAAYRVQAETQLRNPYYTPAERKRRHDADIAMAEQLESKR